MLAFLLGDSQLNVQVSALHWGKVMPTISAALWADRE